MLECSLLTTTLARWRSARSRSVAGALVVLASLLLVVLAAASGASWSIQEVPTPPGATNPGLSGVSCPSKRACIAVGAYNNSTATFSTLAERWNGTNWSVQATQWFTLQRDPVSEPIAGPRGSSHGGRRPRAAVARSNPVTP